MQSVGTRNSVDAPLVSHCGIQRNTAAGLFHILDAPLTEAAELLLRYLHTGSQHVHHHVQLHCQLEQQTADAVLRILHRAAQDG